MGKVSIFIPQITNGTHWGHGGGIWPKSFYKNCTKDLMEQKNIAIQIPKREQLLHNQQKRHLKEGRRTGRNIEEKEENKT